MEKFLDSLALSLGQPVAHPRHHEGMFSNPPTWTGARLLKLSNGIEAKNRRIRKTDRCWLKQLGKCHKFCYMPICVPTRERPRQMWAQKECDCVKLAILTMHLL